jgi:hypothetical protein
MQTVGAFPRSCWESGVHGMLRVVAVAVWRGRFACIPLLHGDQATGCLQGRLRRGHLGIPDERRFAHRLVSARCLWFPVRYGTPLA